jgi:hypothetical protein
VSAFQEGASNDWQVDWIESFELTLTTTEEVTFLFDDFESYPADVVLAAEGWTILDTPEAIEASTWTITNPGSRGNPATLDGSASTGNFLISDSDQQTGSNPVDSGASHDISTPSFSTLGSKTVWLHADVSAQLNNNGAAIFDVDVSTDGGGTWTNVFSRVAPGRVSAEGATTRLPDNTNTDGYFGRLDVDISGVAANQVDVQVRFRHFEPNWDWWIAIDNVLIDNVAAPQGGPITVFSEDFSNGLGQMNVVSGYGNTGTETWHTSDKGGRYVPGTVGEQGVNRLGPHPNEHPEFAIIDSDADPDPNEDEWLMTPSLDLSGMAEVFLHYESETVMSSGVFNQEVLVSLDGGSTFEATPIFAYTGGGLFDNGEEPVYAKRIFDVSGIAMGESQVVFAFRYTGDGDDWWWAIDNVKVSGSPLPEPVDPGTDGLLAYYALDGDPNDSSGNGNDGTIHNADTGGLGDGGSVWVDDPERGTVMSFNGDNSSGAYISTDLIIPAMTMDNDFTWAFWTKQHESQGTEVPGQGNDLILGNRYAPDGSDPLEFIKFTPGNFEYYNNDPDYTVTINYDDIPGGVWIHHAGVKDGTTLTYYRNGVEAGTSTITFTIQANPFFMGGISNGERWSGYMSEVHIYDRALSGGETRYLAGFRSTVKAVPVGHWTLDEGAGTTVADISGNGNHGTIMDNPDLEDPTWIDGVFGGALEFHGTGVAGTGGDFIDCGNDASLDITGPISIALWIRPDADDPEGKGTAGGETAPMAKATSDWSWQVRYGWNSPQPYMAFTFNTQPRAWVYVGKNLERFEWCHIACSYDGTTLKCYLNGEETDSTPMGEIHSSADPVLIGSDGWRSDWIGAIDDVRIYDQGLSEDEILDIITDL